MTGLVASVWHVVQTTDAVAVPNGCIDIAVPVGREPYVIGPRTTAMSVARDDRSQLAGFSLPSWTAEAVLGVAACAILDRVVAVRELPASGTRRSASRASRGSMRPSRGP